MTPEEIKALQDKLAASEAARAKAEADLTSSQKVNDALKKEIISQEKLATAPAATATTSLLPSDAVKHEGKKYKVVFPRVIIDGTEYTAHQVAKDAALIKKLVDQKSGALVEA